MKPPALIVALLAAMVSALPAGAAEPFKEGTTEWAFSVGYGRSFSTDFRAGNVDENITFIPFLVSRSKVLGVLSGGGSWGYSVEGFFSYARQEGSGRYAIGVTPFLFYNFSTHGQIIPYASAGLGLIATNLDPGNFGGDWGFTPQIGVGFRYALDQRRMVRFEYRLHHISNAGLKDDNKSIDSNMFFIGYSMLY